MSEIILAQRTLGTKLAELLKRKPQNLDVIFSVGPDKVKVEAVRIILKAVSPVFESEFETKWDSAVVKEGEGIPLPDVDPAAFELFVHLINSDAWTVEALKSLHLPPSTLLNLLGLCRRFKITDAIKSLEEAARDFIQSFCSFKDTDKFLKLSRENLESIFHFEELPLDEKEIFECASRWAEFHCKENEMELTGENFREVLGNCLFQVRFPTMKLQDFTQVSLHQRNILPDDLKLAIYDFIGMGDMEKAKYDKAKLPFKTIPRIKSIPFGCTVLRLPSEQFQVTTNPPFVCDGSTTYNEIQVTQKIELHGIGFLGPVEKDSNFDAHVKIIFRNAYIGGYDFDECDESYGYDGEQFSSGLQIPNTVGNRESNDDQFSNDDNDDDDQCNDDK